MRPLAVITAARAGVKLLISRFVRDERGQQVAELTIVAPAFIIVLLITFNAMAFASECARFDSLVAQVAIASSTQDEPAFKKMLDQYLDYDDGNDLFRFRVENVRSRRMFGAVAGYTTCEATLVYKPWPGIDFEWSGIRVNSEIKHTKKIVVDQYLPGAVF